MSAWERLTRWLRLDTDGDAADLGRYDASEREMDVRIRQLEARVEAYRLVRERFDDDLRQAERREGTP